MAVQAAEKDGVVSILKVFGEPIRGYVCWYLFSVHGGPVSCDLSAPLGRLSGAYCKCGAPGAAHSERRATPLSSVAGEEMGKSNTLW